MSACRQIASDQLRIGQERSQEIVEVMSHLPNNNTHSLESFTVKSRHFCGLLCHLRFSPLFTAKPYAN
jgi:hypothetical protein